MQLISGMFHPLLTATLMSSILAFFFPQAYAPYSPELAWRFVGAIALLTAFFPALVVLGLYYFTPWVTHLELHERKERIVPFLLFIMFYGIAGKFLVFDLQLGTIVQVLMGSGIVLIVLLVLINTRFKISIHASSAWAISGYALGMAITYPETDLLRVAMAAIAMAGLVGTSRLYLGYHQPKEVWMGSVVGFGYSFLVGLLLL